MLCFTGEVLSKKHLQLNNTIKKLRSKLSDRESTTKDLNESVEKLKDENKSLKSVSLQSYALDAVMVNNMPVLMF